MKDLADHDNVEQVWLPVIGRALAYLCMRNADIANKTIAERAIFLQGLGLNITDVAGMLGTSPASVKELLRQAKNKTKNKGAKKSASNKRKKQ
jgi:DNA-directed RNA polymerase specialized sigma24 family protein